MAKENMSVRKASYLESAWHIDWLLKQKMVDFGTLDYDTAEKFVSVEGDKMMAFLHHHLGLILESVAFRPDADPKERLEAVIELVKNSTQRALSVGAKEIYYISSDPRTDESAVRQLGFDEKPVLCYRKRL